ncbi:MAG: hypothetical protein U5N55_13105 [Cypionkella sp.]|nr:hypothetical protein [Cypionkella sp.]
MTQTNLGNVLQIMGQRAGDDALLGRARDAYTAALRVYSETDTPQAWAITQNNLGVVLQPWAAQGMILLGQARDAHRRHYETARRLDTQDLNLPLSLWATTTRKTCAIS